MKKTSLGAMAAATLLFTSCLGDGNNEQTLQGFGVVDFSMEAMRNVAYIDDYTPICSAEGAFDDLNAGDCIYFTSTYSSDNPANASGKKYLTVTNTAVLNKLDKGDFISRLDTANIKPGEMAVLDAGVLPYSCTQYSFTNHNYLFVGSSHANVATDQKNSYFLECNYDQEPVEVDGKRVYDFFLRVVKNEDGKGVTGTNPFNYAFQTGGFFKTLEARETAAGKETLNIRFNYIKEFNADTTAATWGRSQVYSIQIYTENK